MRPARLSTCPLCHNYVPDLTAHYRLAHRPPHGVAAIVGVTVACAAIAFGAAGLLAVVAALLGVPL